MLHPVHPFAARQPSLPGVEGALTIAREGRRADSRHPGKARNADQRETDQSLAGLPLYQIFPSLPRVWWQVSEAAADQTIVFAVLEQSSQMQRPRALPGHGKRPMG